MTRTNRVFACLLVALALPISVRNAEAQLGALKKKVKEAVKGADQPAATTVPKQDIYADPEVVPITEDQLVRFEKALTFEISELEAAKNLKGPAMTREEYQSCSQNTPMSPEGRKIIEENPKAWANATSEGILKVQQKINTELAALGLKRCGEDPRTWFDRRRARVQEIPGKASDIAMPDGWVPRSRGEDAAPAQSAPSGPWAGEDSEGDARLAAAQMPHPFLRAKAMLTERIVPYCVVIEIGGLKVQVGRPGGGVAINGGPGNNMYIYTSEEARAMEPKCLQLLKLTREVEHQWNLYSMWGVTPP